MGRREEETFNIVLKKTDMKISDSTKNEIEEKVKTLSQQIELMSRYLSHLSKKIDDSLALIKVQEEKIKDLESRMDALTEREFEKL